ncbi:MAG: DUF4363 family protein [Clostridia bacterium]|nr:DUF4363 family protein [Clostridia bacterium]
MKSFAVSICIFLLLLAAIVTNTCYVTQVCDTLAEQLTALPEVEAAEAEAGALFDYWDRQRDLLGISVSAHTLERMSEHLVEMEYAIRCGDAVTFEKNRQTALYMCDEIAETERFSLKNWI